MPCTRGSLSMLSTQLPCSQCQPPPPPPAWPGNLPIETDTEPFLNGNCRMCARVETALAWDIFSLTNPRSTHRQPTPFVGTNTQQRGHTRHANTRLPTAALHTPSGRARGPDSGCEVRTPRSAEPLRTHPQVSLGPLLVLPAHGRSLTRTLSPQPSG